MNKKRIYIISSTLLLIGLFAGIVQYVGMFDALYAAATNPGHSWSQMECSTALCVDTVNNEVEINNIKINGGLYDETGYAGTTGSRLYQTAEGIRWTHPLTWPTASTPHEETDCTLMGGTVYDTGSGTICRLTASTAPEGWEQAGSWQRYSIAESGGDGCGYWKSTYPTTFSNVTSYTYTNGYVQQQAFFTCENFPRHDLYWFYDGNGYSCYVVTNTNLPTYRLEIGVY